MGVFHFLRHGEHGLLGKVLAGRMPGVGMTERGRAEIASQAERLASEKIAAIYASPLQRTRESAEIVAARLGLPIEFRDDLLELDFGEWTGATFDAIRADPRWQAWSTQRSLAAIPGGVTNAWLFLVRLGPLTAWLIGGLMCEVARTGGR